MKAIIYMTMFDMNVTPYSLDDLGEIIMGLYHREVDKMGKPLYCGIIAGTNVIVISTSQGVTFDDVMSMRQKLEVS